MSGCVAIIPLTVVLSWHTITIRIILILVIDVYSCSHGGEGRSDFERPERRLSIIIMVSSLPKSIVLNKSLYKIVTYQI